ncbi:excisionase [Anaerovibrio lipolyticus]|uniref:excisionase n=1 Tax=Anaerovibrio lipolyticus TaxID=82374 RepID=UPI0004833109|nr:excisionase [Anaerovibrio lipolyticus]
MADKNAYIPIWEKYSLSMEEAAAYYGIGVKKLYGLIRSNPNADFILEIGAHCRIKRVMFEKYLDETTAI